MDDYIRQLETIQDELKRVKNLYDDSSNIQILSDQDYHKLKIIYKRKVDSVKKDLFSNNMIAVDLNEEQDVKKRKTIKPKSDSDKQINKKIVTSANVGDKNRTCHRCGNVRDSVRNCPNAECPQVYCTKCVARIEPGFSAYYY